MSNSKTTVTVRIEDQQGELEIIDGRFRVVDRGFGTIQTALPPGIYKARARAGDARNEELFEVEPGATPFEVSLGSLLFASPVPLQDTSTSHEYHQHALAYSTSASPLDAGLGEGATLLLSVRDPSNACFMQQSASPEVQAAYMRSFQRFSLQIPGGEMLIDLSDKAQLKPDEGYTVLNLKLAPGPYILIHEAEDESRTAMPIVAAPGWQTQVFIHVDLPRGLEALGHPNLADRAVMMAPVGQPFQPDDRYFRLTEIARFALMEGRPIIKGDALNQLLLEKFSNPIFGLFAAHLLLLKETPDRSLLGIVVDNLAAMLGDQFPDVAALRLKIDEIDGVSPDLHSDSISFAPLLRSSWNFMAEYPELISKVPLFRQIAGSIIFNGAWLAWQPAQGANAFLSDVLSMHAGTDDGKAELAYRMFAATMIKAFADKLDEKDKQVIAAGPMPATAGEMLAVASLKTRALDDDSSTLAIMIEVAKHLPWDVIFKRIKSEVSELGLMKHLTTLQRNLLPTLQLISNQIAAGEDLTIEDLKQLSKGLNIPLSVLREGLEDLVKKVLYSGIGVATEPKKGKKTATRGGENV